MPKRIILKARQWTAIDRFFHWIWGKIAHPKFWSATMVAMYIILVSAWIPALLNPPSSLEGTVGLVTMYLIASLIVVGAATGAPSAFFGRFSVERWSVVCVGLGIVLYLVVIYTLHWTTGGNRLPQGGTIGALLPGLIGRWVHVSKGSTARENEMLHKTGQDSDPVD